MGRSSAPRVMDGVRTLALPPGHVPAPAPDAPPTEREAWALLLAVDGLGPAGFGALLLAHETALAVLEAAHRPRAAGRLGRIAADAEGRPGAAGAIGRALVASIDAIPERLAELRAAGLDVLTLDDPGYPRRLRAIELPPPVLFSRGAIDILDAPHVVAIVGTRRPTEHGRQVAARLAAVIASTGAVVVSGLAVGIDGAAHAAVVHESGRTAAVIGSGHGRLFPRAHAVLADRILAKGGVVLSEFWPSAPPTKWTFPRRNRVISGLADATIVVEAGDQSGALITARWALEQGRELYFVPGPLGEPRSLGCLLWLRECAGVARIVARIPELIADLGLVDETSGTETDGRSAGRAPRPSLEAILAELGPTARRVGTALVTGRGSLDDLVATTGFEPATVLGAITLLELRGLATTTYGRYRPAGQLASVDPSPTGRSRSGA